MQNKQIVLREYDFIHTKQGEKNYLQRFDDLKNFVLKNEETAQYLKPMFKKGYGEVLQAQNYIGVIQTKDGTTIEILPKIADLDEGKDKDGIETREIVIKMLRTLKDSPFKDLDHANLKSTKMPLFEIFISMFLAQLSKLVQRGIKSDYIDREENLAFLKGKLKFADHIKRNFVHKERFYVEYQEFMSDRIENRLIKTTLDFLYIKSKSSTNQQRIREFQFVFDEIQSSTDPKNDFSKVRLNRQMKDYAQVLLWCKTFLLGNSFSPYQGSDIAFALLFDMNLLFESYVGHYLKKQGITVSLQDKGKYLVEEPNKFALKPDIVIHHEDQQLIADTKWKVINNEKDISQPDMYQLYTYGTKYQECKKLFLIYPKSADITINIFNYFDQNHSCPDNKGLNLQVLFFDLAKDIKGTNELPINSFWSENTNKS